MADYEELPINRIMYKKSDFKRWVDDVRKEGGLTQNEVLEKSGIISDSPCSLIQGITFENSIKIANSLGYRILMVKK